MSLKDRLLEAGGWRRGRHHARSERQAPGPRGADPRGRAPALARRRRAPRDPHESAKAVLAVHAAPHAPGGRVPAAAAVRGEVPKRPDDSGPAPLCRDAARGGPLPLVDPTPSSRCRPCTAVKGLSAPNGHATIQQTMDLHGHLMPDHLDRHERFLSASLDDAARDVIVGRRGRPGGGVITSPASSRVANRLWAGLRKQRTDWTRAAVSAARVAWRCASS
jgi:hypothetical protein